MTSNNTLEEILSNCWCDNHRCSKVQDLQQEALAQIEASYISKEAVVGAIGTEQICDEQCKYLTGWCEHVVHNRYRSEILEALKLDDKVATNPKSK